LLVTFRDCRLDFGFVVLSQHRHDGKEHERKYQAFAHLF